MLQVLKKELVPGLADLPESKNGKQANIKYLKNAPRLFVAGTGTVGGEFIRQVYALGENGRSPVIIGVCNSRLTCWDENGIKAEPAPGSNPPEVKPTNWNAIVQKLITRYHGNLIFVDSTGSREVAALYEKLLEAGIHVVTPSKLANTGSQQNWERLKQLSSGKSGARYFYEATVGAGLPVLGTIRNLVVTGDRITRISGVVSGTMTYIFGELEKGVSFSEAVKNAVSKGYAEPDPRDDLSGEDVARKFMILAREAGFKVERTDFEAESQTPEALKDADLKTFLDRLPEFDDYWREKTLEATQEGNVLRYVGELADGKINVGVRAVPRNSPLGGLDGTDNQIAIYTNFYRDSPVIIQGPGAGSEVTAQAVLGDVLRIRTF